MLKCDSLSVYYGKTCAVHDVTFSVPEGKIVALVGANGAGKSTTLKTISGLLRPSHGTITFNSERIDGMRPRDIVARGIIHVPEGRRIFPGLTVRENLEIGACLRYDDKTSLEKDVEHVCQLFPQLAKRMNQLGWSLSGGEQQMLAIGRGLMAKPKVFLLDEPSLGLAPVLVEKLFEAIKQINAEGLTILLVEQNAYLALNTADLAYVVENGRTVLHGAASDLLKDENVKRAYLGG